MRDGTTHHATADDYEVNSVHGKRVRKREMRK